MPPEETGDEWSRAMVAVPLLAASVDSMEKMVPSVRPSTSVAERVPVMGSPSSSPVPEVSLEMTAGSSTAVMVRSICCVVVPPASSVTVTVN